MVVPRISMNMQSTPTENCISGEPCVDQMTSLVDATDGITERPNRNQETASTREEDVNVCHKSAVDDGLKSSQPPARVNSFDSTDSIVPLSERPKLYNNRAHSIDNSDISRRRSKSFSTDDEADAESLDSDGVQKDGLPGSRDGDRLLSSTGDIGTIGFEVDQAGNPSAVLGKLNSPNIEDDTPAAAAMRANREVKVPKMGKFARTLHAQTVRRFIKRATLRAKSGNRRGKPPRIPPSHQKEKSQDTGIYVVEEEDEGAIEDENDMDSSIESVEEGTTFVTAAAAASSKVSGGGIDIGDVMIGNMEDLEPKKHRTLIEQVRQLEQVPVDVLAATLETGKKILATADPHDIIHLQRFRRRKRDKRKSGDLRKSYVKGKVIDGQHELYALSIAVMLGVRTSIGTTNAQMTAEGRRWLTSDDFMATEKYEFKPSGGFKTPPHQLGHTFKFKDYSPIAFAYLRRMFGVNEFDFLLSVCGNANFIEFISNAKSGQFFFYSSDGKYMVKTMTNAESKFLRRILPHYFRHCSQNPNTMMTKFLGMYRVKLYHLRRNVKFVIMNSVYYTDKFLQSFYDLKGSVTGRDSKPGQDVKKDNDLRLGLPESSLALPPDVRSRILEQITSDCEFMSRMKIMDYSMLVGIHHIPPKRGISSERSIGNSGFRFSAERRESRSSLRDVVKRTAVGSPVISSLAGKSGDGSIVSVQGTAPPNLSLDDASLSDHHVHFSEGSNVSGDQQKVAGVKQNPNSSVTPSDKDDLSTIGGNSRTSEDHSSMLAMSMYEFALDDDDDNSYLEGSVNHPVVMPTMGTAGASKMAELAVKKEQTTENVYWPFHRYYDLNGYRRMIPCRCTKCGVLVPCSCEEDKASRQGFKIPDFVLPLSDRKDGGLTMDTTGFKMPMKLKGPNGRDQHYDGKIFYMGIIDILQQYNIRKRIEARYRRIKGSGWKDASCVHPSVYAERFIAFFDEYSQRSPTATETPLQKGEEAIVFYDPKRDNEDTKEEIELTRVEYPMEIGDETVAITINKHLKTE